MRKYYWLAIGVSLLAATSNSFSEEQGPTRGVKPKVPIKPYFSDPLFEEKPQEVLTPVLPQPEFPRGEQTLSQQLRVRVNKIILRGNTLFTAEEVNGFVEPYLGRDLSMNDLNELRKRLTLYYSRLGYINSGVVIPDQKIENSTLILQVIEGGIENLSILGLDKVKDKYIAERIEDGVAQPLNIDQLKRSLSKLQSDSLIKKVDAKLSPGDQLGKARLGINIVEAKSNSVNFRLDNHRTPSVGAEALIVTYTNRNVSGIGDIFEVSATGSEGLNNGYIGYSYPFGLATRLSFDYQVSDTDVVEDPFDDLDISSESSVASIGLRHTISLNSQTEITPVFNFVTKKSEAFLFGEPYSFSQGANEGESRTSVAEFGFEWSRRTNQEVLSLALRLRQGLDVMDATEAEEPSAADILADPTAFAFDEPEGEFSAFLGFAQYAKRINRWKGSQVIARLAAQYAADPLLSIEKFAVGGHSSVRGYRENQLVRDNGITSSLEFRLPVFLADQYNIYRYQVITFVDWGKGWNEPAPETSDEKISIYSAGIGFLWRPYPGVNLNLTWAEALEDDDVDTSGDDIQDDGLHFYADYTYRF